MIKIIHESDEDNALNLSRSQKHKWDYIVKAKGAGYLLGAIAKAFKDSDGKSFDRLLQNIFVSMVKDYDAGKRMASARKDDVDEYEVDPNDIPPR